MNFDEIVSEFHENVQKMTHFVDAVVPESDNVKPIVDVKDGVDDSGERPVKPAKRRLSDPKPACIINPNIRELPSKQKRQRVHLHRKKVA